MKYFLIDKKTKQVKSISDSNIDYDKKIFNLKQLSWTQTNKDEWDKSIALFYRKNKFEFIYNNEEIKKENQEKIKKDLKKAKSIDELKTIINKIIK